MAPGSDGVNGGAHSSETSADAGAAAPRTGTLRFNWRVVMMPPALIEYIVVHELAHLTVMNHSADFWELVDGVLPERAVAAKAIARGRTRSSTVMPGRAAHTERSHT